MWKKLINKFHARKNLLDRTRVLEAQVKALQAELDAIDALLDVKYVAFSELGVRRNVELSIDNMRWHIEQLQCELLYYKQKYGEDWKL